MAQENDINDLIRIHNEVVEERDKLLNDIKQLQHNLDENVFKQNEFERQIQESNDQLARLQEKNIQTKNDYMKEAKKRQQIELELRSNKQHLELKTIEFDTQTKQYEIQKEELKKSQQNVKKLKEDNIRLTKGYEILQLRFDDLTLQRNELITTTDRLNNDRSHQISELKEKEDELIQLRKSRDSEQRRKDQIEKHLRQVQNEIGEIKHEREQLESTILTFEQEIDQLKRTKNDNEREINLLKRKRDTLNKTYQKLIIDHEKQMKEIQSSNQIKKALQQDIIKHKDEVNKQRDIVLKTEKERDRYITDATLSGKQVSSLMDMIKERELEVFGQNKKIEDLEKRLKEQEDLCDTVRSERDLYSKNLNESKDEINEMKRRIKILYHQINQLKEEIQSKEQDFGEVQNQYEKIKKHKEQLVINIEQLTQEVTKKQQAYTIQQVEVERLNKQLTEENNQRKKQITQLQQVTAERNVLGSQLVRRNDELALLYEKLRIQQLTLTKGEVQYKARLEDLRIFKLEIKKLTHEKDILQDRIENIDDLKREIFHVQRELIRERTRCRALEEELENPMNVHRWRKLEGSDPSKFELIQKIQRLQKRLIQKTEEVVQKDLIIIEKDKLHAELKQILTRQADGNISEQLLIYQDTLKTKTKQMKCLISEVNMYESQIENYKNEIEQLNQQLIEVRQKYFLLKKKEEKRVSQTQPPDLIQSTKTNNQVRFTGGGFNLKSIPKSSTITA